jgi:hypothetical protein
MAEKVRTLVAAWAALIAFSFVLAFAGDVIHPSRLGIAMLLAVVIAAGVKAHLVLRFYLGLKVARGALAGFTSAVVFTLVVVAMSLLIFPTPR